MSQPSTVNRMEHLFLFEPLGASMVEWTNKCSGIRKPYVFGVKGLEVSSSSKVLCRLDFFCSFLDDLFCCVTYSNVRMSS